MDSAECNDHTNPGMRSHKAKTQTLLKALRQGLTGSACVRGLRGDGLGIVECERIVHEATVAASVRLGVLDQLLLRE